MDALPDYAELHALSNFSFLRGASHAAELIQRARELGYAALALTDECSMAGVVRAHMAAREAGLPLIIGAEFTLECGLKFVALAATRRGYGQICQLITRGRRAAPKGSYHLARADLTACIAPATGAITQAEEPDCLILWRPQDCVLSHPQAAREQGAWLAARYPRALWVGVSLLRTGQDAQLLRALLDIAAGLGLRCVACGDVHMHEAGRRRIQDTLTAIRHRVALREAGQRLYPNGERHLRAREELARLYPPALLAESMAIAARCRFSLDELRYQYPREIVPEGQTPASYLRQLTEAGAAERWPRGVPVAVRALIEKELAIIAELKYEPFFLTVYDVVRFARGEGILCQGRGSAANSIVCFCLKVTSVGPGELSMLFERFVSKERDEPPDIDIDFEHERREEVIQHIYRKYGRHRAALAATVITYSARSVVRDLIRVLEVGEPQARALIRGLRGWHGHRVDADKLREAGVDMADPTLVRLLELAATLVGFPRHLSQHVGGFVISEGPLSELVPVENATMPERTVIQWDKDDLEDLGLLKVDVLALGMLTAIRKCFAMVREIHGEGAREIHEVPPADAAVYDMICRSDTVGVFQIESRAQMSMLPRLKPRDYYDLVIEVAIVRPGPIQGDMVHPYLRRRSGEEPIVYPSEAVRGVLARTCGVPIFQEQVMQIAIVAAGFTPGEADQLRRAMAAWKRRGGMEKFELKLLTGMRERGYADEFATAIIRQIRGFSDYGFPEAHAASFALLAYVSAWLKHHHPAAFTASLLNSQPMGFYQPAQLLRDARAHGVEVRAADVRVSDIDCTLERAEGGPALRLGLRCVRSLGDAAKARIVAARQHAPFADLRDLGDRARLARHDMEALAAAGALAGFGGHRHLAYWRVAGYLPPLATAPDAGEGAQPLLRAPSEFEDVEADYRALGFTLGRHPLALLREQLSAARVLSAQELDLAPDGAMVRVAGLVITRQRPMTASGVTFVTLEDESGQVNVVVWRQLGERRNAVLTGAHLMEARGMPQRESGVTHLIARDLLDRTALIGALRFGIHEFH
ncbi:MAG: error-prone DNA polymerase [Proteobacteria bacterium]|nr:error-prone DNA polymerase [Pseudomonadota bacterium]